MTAHGDSSQTEPTQLQVWLAAAYDVLEDARAALPSPEYEVFVCVFCERVGLEAGRLLVGELLREERRHEQDAA